MGSFSIFHWLIVILVLLLLFGPKRFADAAKGLGQALRGFKDELRKPEEDPKVGADADSKRLPPSEPTATTPEGKRDA